MNAIVLLSDKSVNSVGHIVLSGHLHILYTIRGSQKRCRTTLQASLGPAHNGRLRSDVAWGEKYIYIYYFEFTDVNILS